MHNGNEHNLPARRAIGSSLRSSSVLLSTDSPARQADTAVKAKDNNYNSIATQEPRQTRKDHQLLRVRTRLTFTVLIRRKGKVPTTTESLHS